MAASHEPVERQRERRTWSTHLPGAVGALDAELVDPTGRVLADDRLKVIVRVLGLHRRHRVRQPLGGRELQERC